MTKTPNLGLTYYEAGQLQPEVTINGNSDILDSAIGSQSSAFGYDAATSTGLTYGYFGGPILVNGFDTLIAAGTILLTASATNYVQRTAAGAVSANTTGFTLGLIPMAIVTTSASAITLPVLDRRPSAYDRQGRIVVTTTGGALTLTAAQANAKILSVQGVLTSNSVLTLPNLQQDWTVSNETTGAFTLTVQIGAGTPLPIGQGLARRVYGNGTTLIDADSAKAERNGDSAQPFYGSTPAQWDISNLLASTAFVRQAVGSYSGFNFITADTTLPSTAYGGFFKFSTSTSVTATLPAQSSISAQVITFKNDSGVDCYIHNGEAGGIIFAPGTPFGSGVTITLSPGESIVLLNRASTEWDVVYGTWLQNRTNSNYRGSNSFTQPVSAANATTSGQLLALGQSITGGTRTDVTASRSVSTAYTNSLTRPIKVYIAGTSTASNAWLARQIGTGTVFYAEISNSGNHVTLELLVMPGETYTITSNNVTINMWEEIR